MTSLSRSEAERVAALHDLEILDTPPEDHFEAVCRTARRLFGVADAFVSLVDADRQWLKTVCGIIPPTMPRETSFCTHTIRDDAVMVVPDARRDPRFSGSSLVTSEVLAFYAGAPLILAPGVRVGALCLVDTAPRAFSDDEVRALRDLAEIVVAHLRLHQANRHHAREVETRAAREVVIAAQAAEIDRRAEAQASANHLLSMAEEMAHIGHWRVALDDGQPVWSAGLFRIAGRDPAERPPHLSNFTGIYHPGDRERLTRIVGEAVALGRNFAFEARILRPDGSERAVEVCGTCQKDAFGATTALFGILIDVTERRATEAEIRLSEIRYRSLADTLPLLVWTMRASDGEATYLNACFRAYYGPIGTDRVGRLARNHPEDAPVVEAAWEQALATGEGFAVECRLQRHDGPYRWHKLAMTPVRHRDGTQVVEWLGTALDIDEIISAHLAVEEAQELLHLGLEAADAGTWDWDMRRGVTVMSSESARIYGLPNAHLPQSLTTAEWTALVHPDDVAQAWEAIRVAIDTRTIYATEFRVGERWVHARGRTLFGPDDRPYRMVGLHIDITERKSFEATLQALTAEAQAARAEAERASEAKSDFLAAMSHEIRTPLNGVLGYADLLLEQAYLTEEDRRRLELIQNSGAALLTIVNDILDFSKIEAGQLVLDPLAFPLLTVIDNTVSIVRGGALKSGLRIDARIDAALPGFVVGDPNRLRQVLLNLLNNAVKFTPAGAVTLNVRHAGARPEGEAMRFEVTDTGIGIPDAQLPRLFKRFSQVDGSISRRFGGTGLGLAICRHLVGMMGGEIGVESREGVGSTFWFTLTLPRAEQAPAQTPEQAPAATERSVPRILAAEAGAAPHLLLVEDVPINQELARAVLESQGFRVDVAGDGAEAVAAVEARMALGAPYALVLMDVQMPGMDGLTATRCIRALPAPAGTVPIVAMTANVMPQQVEALREAGMDDHVGKPFRRADLFATIARWIGSADAEPAPEAAPVEGPLVDREALSAVRDSIGAPRVLSLLALLEGELRDRFRPGETDRMQIAYDAHAMVSAAGMLGFVGLSELCREIEAAAHAGSDLNPLIRRLDTLRSGALGTIRELRAA
ncbi:PAS domain-containing protein [Methylobacterium planeticum]|uniref:Sensory/regulatory protein RpfC n=1 Tax=Methylobacterium planeticum TaxID=2615211 RepID=A0A6N6MLN2_9HYPH|nr:PAS domain-containing protein [Methylobacterium planeticum]KAB1070088.1 PAS domain-containing protein [Methylobacterium planeticum]